MQGNAVPHLGRSLAPSAVSAQVPPIPIYSTSGALLTHCVQGTRLADTGVARNALQLQTCSHVPQWPCSRTVPLPGCRGAGGLPEAALGNGHVVAVQPIHIPSDPVHAVPDLFGTSVALFTHCPPAWVQVAFPRLHLVRDASSLCSPSTSPRTLYVGCLIGA